jgi:hypothetical protein
MSARRVAALLVTAILGIFPVPARAADPPSPAPMRSPPPRTVRLDYVRSLGAERCPGEQAFRDAVGAKVARDLFAAVPKPSARLVVMLGRRGTGYEGSAELRDAAGAATWSMVFPSPPHPPAATCASLIAALAFGLSIEVDPVDPPSVDPPLPPVVEPPIVKPPLAKHEVAPGPFRIGVSPWLDLATAPRPAFGISLGLGFRVAWFSLDLEGHWDPPAASTIEGAEVGTSRFVGALVPCGHVRYFAGCLVTEVGPLRGSLGGAGIQGGTQSAIYVATGGRLSAEVELAPHLALRPAVDLLLALQRPALRYAEVPLWRAPAISAGVGVGLLASF